jgi:UDP-N-acetylmuramoyl-tripeptide--D-alanyl-D-alanine ligase
MKSLWDALPSEHRGGYAEPSRRSSRSCSARSHHDDAVMVKGSLGCAQGPIVKALKRRYAPAEANRT